jgi:LPS-assembly protein
VDISAKRLEYFSQNNTYIAKGSVMIVFEDITLQADEVHFNSNTYDAMAIGNVIYEDSSAIITSDRIELNLKTKLGTIYKGYIFYKKHNFHIHAGRIDKIGDKTFFLDKASFTTCDSEVPSWSISGKDIKLTQHKSLRAWHASLHIKTIPILYTPYVWVPLIKKRQTGFLLPSFGYSSARGYYYKQGFFWAIKDNQDVTLYLDYYSEKGFAEGLDYRYILSPKFNGEFWVYHVRDDEPSRDLFEYKTYHNYNLSYDISGYLKVHAVNEYDYYQTMDSTSAGRFGLSSWEPEQHGFASEERLHKYLESNLHLSKFFSGGRTYILGQVRQSLEGSSREIPQSLPEIGLILNTQSRKYLSFNMAIKGSNFWRKEEQRGLRFDINPNLYFSYGRIINITQGAGIRGTFYFLKDPHDYEDRILYDLSTTLSTRFFKRYLKVIHTIEPSLEYEYIRTVNQINVPSFDSIDSIPKTNNITYSLTNRISGFNSNKIEARFRVSQSYSLLNTEKHFTPLLAEMSLSGDIIDISANASYDVHENRLSESIASIKLHDKTGYIGIGKNFRRLIDLDQYTVEVGINSPIRIKNLSLPVDFHGKLLYDVDRGDVQEMSLISSYIHQCWKFSAAFNQQPDEYQIIFAVELMGLGTIKLGSI